MVETLTQAIHELVNQLDKYLNGQISGELIEDIYTTNIMIHDDYDLLNEKIQNIVELIDNEINNLSKEEIKQARNELIDLLRS